jgi:hypothetical protein
MGRFSLVAAIAVAVFASWATQAEAYVYWSTADTKTIGRANLDGSGAADTFISGAGAVFGLAVDDRRVYWADMEGRLSSRGRRFGAFALLVG